MRSLLSTVLPLFVVFMIGCASTPKRETAEQLTPGKADQLVSVARLAERHGDVDEASQLYERLIQQGLELPTSHHRLGVIAAKQHSFSAAQQHFASARQAGLNSIDFRIDEAFLHWSVGENSKAEEILREILQTKPKHERALNNLAILRASQGGFAESLALSRRAVGSAKAHANLGYLLTQFGDIVSAEDSFHRALEEEPDLEIAATALMQIAKLPDDIASSQALPLAPDDDASPTNAVATIPPVSSSEIKPAVHENDVTARTRQEPASRIALASHKETSRSEFYDSFKTASIQEQQPVLINLDEIGAQIGR